MVKVLSEKSSILNKFVAEIRDVDIQGDSMRFRRNLERIGEVMAYEISKGMEYEKKSIQTPLGESEMAIIKEEVVLATVMRAGVPLHQGFLNYFDDSSSAFVSAYRKSHKDNSFEVNVQYVSCGDLEGKTLIMIDPMLATGASLVLAYQALCEKGGEPSRVIVAAAVSSEQGVDYLKSHMPMSKCEIWTAALDDELTSKFYIVPGIGDAGDLAYGSKL